MKIAAFLSHPIQHFSPLWKEVAGFQDVCLKVFYYSRHATEHTFDPEFGKAVKWDVDLLEGYESEFLRRQWPTRDIYNFRWYALNRGISRALDEDWDVAYVAGYAHLNNWYVSYLCSRRKIKLLYHSDSNYLAESAKPRWKRWLKRQLIKPFFGHVAVYLSVGDNNRNYLRHYGAPEDRIRFCAIPVDIVRFRQAAVLESGRISLRIRGRFGISEGACVLGFCGKLIRRKRPGDLLSALLQDDVKKTGVVGLFIGDGDLEAALKEMAGETAHFAGFVNQSELPLYLAVCDVLVMPSEYDPHPIVVTEAQSLGIPVILSDQCGCHGPNDVFRAGESGLLYRCGDVRQLADHIVRLARDSQLRMEMGRRAAQLANLHSAQSAAADFVEAARFAMHMH